MRPRPEIAAIAVGNISRDLLSDYDVVHVRHPSNGGAPEFRTRMEMLMREMAAENADTDS